MQGGQDSNLQQPVLETGTLPIELPPYGEIGRAMLALLHFTYLVSLWPVWCLHHLQYFFSSKRAVVCWRFFIDV